jgi:hypothetical protein
MNNEKQLDRVQIFIEVAYQYFNREGGFIDSQLSISYIILQIT